MRRRLDQCREGQIVAAPDHERQVLQDDGHADGGDQRREPGRFAQRTVGDFLHPVGERHAYEDSDDEAGENDQDRRQLHVRAEERRDHRQRDHRADHHHFAVGKVDQADDAVDHGVAQRDQSIDAAQRQAVDDLLQKRVHGASGWRDCALSVHLSVHIGIGEFSAALRPTAIPAPDSRSRSKKTAPVRAPFQGTLGRIVKLTGPWCPSSWCRRKPSCPISSYPPEPSYRISCSTWVERRRPSRSCRRRSSPSASACRPSPDRG